MCLIAFLFKLKCNYDDKLKGTHRVRTHDVLLNRNPNLDLCPFNPQNHTTCRISEGHSRSDTKFEHYEIFCF